MTKTLVLGGTGWSGHQIALALSRAGYDVTIGSRGAKQAYLDELDSSLRLAKVDKSDAQQMGELLREGFDAIVDSVPTEASIDAVFEHAQGLKHYVHCSSTGGYAPLPVVPGDETLPYDHFMGGWRGKQIVDDKVLDLHRREGFPATVIRPSYITGPGLLPLDNLGGRRPDFIPDLLAEREVELPNDGLALLHPVHCADLAESFRLALDKPAVSIGQIYNACLDRAVTLTRYVQLNAEALGRQAKIRYVPLDELCRKHDGAIDERGLRFLATHMCYDITKIKTQLGYQPRCTVEEAIAENARWAAEQAKG